MWLVISVWIVALLAFVAGMTWAGLWGSHDEHDEEADR